MSDQKTLENETLIKQVLKNINGTNGWLPFVEEIRTPECAQVGICRHLSHSSTFSQTDSKVINGVELIKNKTNMSFKDKK